MIDITTQLDRQMDNEAYQESVDYWVQEALAIRKQMRHNCACIKLRLYNVELDRMLHPQRREYRNLTTLPDEQMALQMAMLYGHLAWFEFKGWVA